MIEIKILALYPSERSNESSKSTLKTYGNIEILPELLFRSKPTININSSESQITFHPNAYNNLNLLSLHINALGHFMTIEILIEDTQQNFRKMILTNKKSKIVITEKECVIPIKVGSSWQYVCINLMDLMKKAFGMEFYQCKEVTLKGICKISCIYFHNEPCADVALPKHLQVFDHA